MRDFISCVQFLPDSTHQQHQTPRSTILTTKTYAQQYSLLHSMLTILSLRQGRLPSHVPKAWSALYCPSALYTMMNQEKKVRIRMHLEVSPRLRRVIASIPSEKKRKTTRSDAQLPSCPALPRYQGLTKPRFHRGSASASCGCSSQPDCESRAAEADDKKTRSTTRAKFIENEKGCFTSCTLPSQWIKYGV